MGIYKHFKNKYYLKLFEVRNADNCNEIDVVYMSLYKKDFPRFTIWRRSKEMFESEVVRDGKKLKRYKKII